MKTAKRIIGIVFLIAVLILTIVISVTAMTKEREIPLMADGSLSKKEAEAFIEELQKKDLGSLIRDVNELDFSKTEEDKIYYYYEVIKNKLRDASAEEISSVISSPETKDDVKINILTLCEAEGIILDYDGLLSLLEQDTVSAPVKNLLLDLLTGKGDNYADLLEEKALSADDTIIQKALSDLYVLRPDTAVEIADSILSDLSGPFSAKIKAALLTKAIALQENPSDREIEKFVHICDHMLKNMSASDEEERNATVIASLAQLENRISFSYLMSLEGENYEDAKSFIVYENKNVVDALFNEKPDADTVSLILKAAPYYFPNEEIVENIQKYLEKNAEYFEKNKEQKDLLAGVIQYAAES